MKKSHLDALGKVFTAEITDSLPFQSKAKVYAELEVSRACGADGLSFHR